MPGYEEWNEALIKYFLNGVPQGSSIFLDVNERVLEEIGQTVFSNQPSPIMNWTSDFIKVVRGRCMRLGQMHLASLPSLSKTDTQDRPQSVAFLALLVLAAYRMSESGTIDNTNFFTRLREILKMPGTGRPDGMAVGEEERLWEDWNLFLGRQGYLATAQKGTSSYQFINYAISQSILRTTDRRQLQEWFEDRKWPKYLDQELVAARIRRNAKYFSKHLLTLIRDSGFQRFQAIKPALFEVYEEWTAGGVNLTYRPGSNGYNRVTRTRLIAGIYRVADPFAGTTEYFIYPQQPRNRLLLNHQILRFGEAHPLTEDRPGWFTPLWSLQAGDLDKEQFYQLEGTSDYKELIIPWRDFWVLVPETDNPESGVFANWGPPPLNSHFVLLCKKELQGQLLALRNDGLIDWESIPIHLESFPGWVEYQDLMITAEAWGGTNIESQDLLEALRPLSGLSIKFEGGMRIPQLGAWLEGYPPQITVSAFESEIKLKITRLETGKICFEELVKVDTVVPFKWPGLGDYLITAKTDSVGRDYSERLVKIISWDQFPLPPVTSLKDKGGMIIQETRIFGSVLERLQALG